MPLVRVQNCGAVGVVKDLSAYELPIAAWTDALNIRFLDGSAYQFLGHGEVYNSPAFAPQFVMPVYVAGIRYWIYTTAAKTYAVTNTAGVAVHTDITHATPRTGVINAWTGTLLGGIPILNTGDVASVPMSWDLNLANKFVNLANWPAATYCKSLRSFRNIGVALGVNKGGVSYPFMVKFSHPADPGGVPITWDQTDATKDAGEFDLAEGEDIIIDGLQLRSSFIVYKEHSVWRLEYVGGAFVLQNQKVLGMSGAMNRNCIVEIDGFHCVLTGSDVVVHDGQQATSILDKQARRYLFQSIDVTNSNLCFVFKNPFLNEAYICYPSIGATACDRALVWNYKDKTVSFRTLPSISHAAYGSVDNTLSGNWNQDPAPWSSDLTAWDGPDYTPSTARVIMASTAVKLYMLDASASFDGVIPDATLERRGLAFDAPNNIKLIRGIRPIITGNNGDTVIIEIGSASEPFADPVYTTMTHTIGTTVADDCFVSGRYIAIRFRTGTAYQWRLDGFQIDCELQGEW